MTSQQTQALQRYQDAAAAYVTACAGFTHAFAQDPEIALTIENSAQNVGESAHQVAAWKSGHAAR